MIDELDSSRNPMLRRMQSSQRRRLPKWWPEDGLGLDRASPFFQDYVGVVKELNHFLEDLYETKFCKFEKYKLAVAMHGVLAPRFSLGPNQLDRGRQTQVLKQLGKAHRDLSKAINTLRSLPYPANLQVNPVLDDLIHQQGLRKIERLQSFYQYQKAQVQSKANERAVVLARFLRIGFERYTSTVCRASKDSDGYICSAFALGVERLFHHIGLEVDAFEPARQALSDGDDEFFTWAVLLLLEDPYMAITL
ncbi:hypothetical protein FLO80_10865 [Aquicoccus porphyridii]|uniref:Uncharacterized protein n=1 Tax=Aquicoccus porphyridii TaxID=1852029 RepID=A0A5A9ZCR1_9RHOB|nr:hypothetical protein [Aquicoccus porphyridii]KAA0914866.1 hypothetical protein FLO80_10865 [Aquicoccus porphyridii]RAI52588.1 hypothetical protein DOO74_17385 [Rhodobacteraceae bacterium AsT-22]